MATSPTPCLTLKLRASAPPVGTRNPPAHNNTISNDALMVGISCHYYSSRAHRPLSSKLSSCRLPHELSRAGYFGTPGEDAAG